MDKLYEEIEETLKKVDFSEIWEGFCQYPFALYDEKKAYYQGTIINRPEHFRGNTTVMYENQQIAIWNVGQDYFGEGEDVELLAANMVHEMFHAFQVEHGEERFPNDLEALNYPQDVRNYAMKYVENQKLAKIFQSGSQEERGRLLMQICDSRRLRQEKLGKYLDYEFYIETMEGMAEYAGTMALKMISPDKYEKKIKNYIQKLSQLSPLLLDNRMISYYSGAMLLIAVKEMGISVEHLIGEEERTVFEILKEKLQMQDSTKHSIMNWDDIEAVPEIERLLQESNNEKQRKLESFFEKKTEYHPGEYQICGYDPMNMLLLDKLIYGSHFFMLKDKNTGEMITISQACVLETAGGDIGKIQGYYLT